MVRIPSPALARPKSAALALALTFVCALALPSMLGGCATPQERAAHMQAEVEAMMALYGPACARLGYTVQSDPWRQCVLDLGIKDDLTRYGPYGPAGAAGFGWGPGGRWHGRWGQYW